MVGEASWLARLSRWLRPRPRGYEPVVRTGFEEAWAGKVRAVCAGLLERLAWDRAGRALVWGAGSATFLRGLFEGAPPVGKVLTVLAGGAEAQEPVRRALDGRPGADRVVFVDGRDREVLEALPPGSLALAVSAWGLAAADADRALAAAARALRPDGRLALLDTIDGTPQIPLWALARALRQVPGLSARRARTGLPHSVRQLRRRIARAGCADPRVWQDGLTLGFASGAEAWDGFLRLGGEQAFTAPLDGAAAEQVRAACVRDLEARWCWDGEIPVTLEIVGAVARRP